LTFKESLRMKGRAGIANLDVPSSGTNAHATAQGQVTVLRDLAIANLVHCPILTISKSYIHGLS
jgi:hypothetical protein